MNPKAFDCVLGGRKSGKGLMVSTVVDQGVGSAGEVSVATDLTTVMTSPPGTGSVGTLFKVSVGPGPILVMTEFEWMCAPETASPTDKPRRAV